MKLLKIIKIYPLFFKYNATYKPTEKFTDLLAIFDSLLQSEAELYNCIHDQLTKQLPVI
jgi:hypothetical protein